jgi:hypothetical protein
MASAPSARTRPGTASLLPPTLPSRPAAAATTGEVAPGVTSPRAKGRARHGVARWVVLLLPALFLAGCDGDPSGAPATVSVQVAATLGLPLSASEAGTLELAAFRTDLGEGASPLGQVSLPVAAGERSWSGSFSGLPAGASVRVEATLRGASGGSGAVQWSGEATLTLPAAGSRGVSLLLRAGPAANAAVTGATFSGPSPLRLETGASTTLSFSVEGGAAGNARVLVLNPGVARVASFTPGSGGNGTLVVEGVAPGEAQILLLSGLRLAQLGVVVDESISALEVLPGSGEFSTLGDSLALVVRALTPSGVERPLPGAVVWSAADEGVVRVSAQGVVEAVGNGETRVEARVDALPGIVGEASFRVRQVATRLEAVAGDGLQGTVGGMAAPAPRVRALDARGNPVPGVAVTFATSGEGAEVVGASQATNEDGEATVGGWRFGVRPGLQRLEAVAEGGLVFRFSAQVAAGAPAVLEALALLVQEARVGEEVSEEPRVRLSDAFGNPLAGVALRFEPLGDRGSVSVPLVLSDELGEAGPGAWQVGNRAGSDTLRVRVEGAEGEGATPLLFQAEVAPGDPAVILTLEGGGQTAVVGTPVPVDPVFQLLDTFGNPVSGAEVTLFTEDAGASLEHAARVSAEGGTVRAGGWTLGTVAGPQRLQVSSGDATLLLEATALPAPVGQLEVVEGDGQSAPVGTALATHPAVRALDAFGNPVPGISVTFQVTAGGGTVAGASATTDSVGVATAGAWTLGPVAGLQSMSASAGGVSLVLQATATTGSPAGLSIVAGDGQSGEVAGTLPVAPRVRLVDGFGNPVEGASVTFAVIAGGGSLASTGATTGPDGEAAAGAWTLGSLGGTNRVRATSGAFQVEFQAQATVPCLALAVGESYETTLEGAASLCFEGGMDGAEFTWIPASTSVSPLALTLEGTQVVPVVGPPSPFMAAAGLSTLLDPGTTGLVAGGPASAPVRDYPSLRLEDARGLALATPDTESTGRLSARLLGGAAADGEEVALPLIPPGVPTVGDTWVLNVAPACAGARDDRAATVQVVGTHVILVTDDANPAGGFTPGDLADLAAELDAVVYPAVTGAFGTPTDVDGNGRVVVFLTAAVNGDVTGANFNLAFVRSDPRDLLDSADCERSNEGEILYAAVPDPDGDETFIAIPTAVAFAQTARGVARELRNLVGAGARLGLGASDEAPWLNAALNAIAEELAFYAASGDLVPGMNIGAGTFTTAPRAMAINRYGSANILHLDQAVQAPGSTAPFRDAVEPEQADLGLSWAFLRYAADRVGGNQDAFWTALTQSPLSGRANLEAATGAPVDAWYRDFLAALYADDVVPGLEARLTQPSWNFRDLFAGSALGTFDLGVSPLDDGVPLALALGGDGGSAFVRFGVAPLEAGTVNVLSGGSSPVSSEPVIVVRTR